MESCEVVPVRSQRMTKSSPLDERDRRLQGGRDPRLKDWASRFLCAQLPEQLRPSETNRRLQAALVWGGDQFLDVRDVPEGRALTVGPGTKAGWRLFHEALHVDVPLVSLRKDVVVVFVPVGAQARVLLDGQERSLEELSDSGVAHAVDLPQRGVTFELSLHDRVEVEFGGLRIIARCTRGHASSPGRVRDRLDAGYLSTLAILLLVGATFRLMLEATDFDRFQLAEELVRYDDRIVRPVAPEPHDLLTFEPGEVAPPAEGESGTVGLDAAIEREAAPSREGSGVVDPEKRRRDLDIVNRSGVLALLNAGAASEVFGSGGLGGGIDEHLGGLTRGGVVADAQGTGGLSTRGGGTGGGGDGPLNIGQLGGKGTRPGGPAGFTFDEGKKAPTRLRPGTTFVEGGLTAEEVGLVVRRHWNEIKHCYERELQLDPNLAGKVAVQFEIGPVGLVTRASIAESSMNSAAVEGCMLEKVRRWKFPAPRGGGVVQVKYPFILKTG